MTARRAHAPCAHCGAPVARGARACRECGSDAATGWQDEEEIDYAMVDLPDGYREAGQGDELPPAPPRRWLIVTALLAAAALAAAVVLRR